MLEQQKYRILIQQYKNKIYTYSLYMLKNKMDAEDVTQEVMIKIWQNVDKFNILAAKTWIMKTTNNLCIDYLRRRAISVSREFEIDEIFEDTYSNNLTSDNPYLVTHLNMMTSRIKEAIKRLPENLRSVFVLYEIEGFKYREISKSLEMPVNSVKVYLMRARKKLQEELKHYEAQEVI
ncbi:MAG: sigma-70 family RNA polymerase sigma factor [Ignavibacteriales bacterium]|nr:sigma-70 family RNA polymerase sigma factor [Ignavibacteriales bacterium]